MPSILMKFIFEHIKFKVNKPVLFLYYFGYISDENIAEVIFFPAAWPSLCTDSAKSHCAPELQTIKPYYVLRDL
jgi:hypothetical protein